MLISSDIQTFITTTEIDKINNKIKESSKLFHITDDGIKEV